MFLPVVASVLSKNGGSVLVMNRSAPASVDIPGKGVVPEVITSVITALPHRNIIVFVIQCNLYCKK